MVSLAFLCAYFKRCNLDALLILYMIVISASSTGAFIIKGLCNPTQRAEECGQTTVQAS